MGTTIGDVVPIVLKRGSTTATPLNNADVDARIVEFARSNHNMSRRSGGASLERANLMEFVNIAKASENFNIPYYLQCGLSSPFDYFMSCRQFQMKFSFPIQHQCRYKLTMPDETKVDARAPNASMLLIAQCLRRAF